MSSLQTKIQSVVSQFFSDDIVRTVIPLEKGIINRTYAVETEERHLLVQTINTSIFKNPEAMMENIALVTSHQKRKLEEKGIQDERKCLTFFQTTEGKSYTVLEGEYWRISNFIEDSRTYEDAHSTPLMEKTGNAFGCFQKELADIEMTKMTETIPGFHDTEARIKSFWKKMVDGFMIPERVVEAEKEIQMVKKWGETFSNLSRCAKAGTLPLRATHNDTKTNNILFDRYTEEFLCIIDLDTVMPGLAAYDVADSIRFSANTAAEDEEDLSKVSLDLSLVDAYLKGYLSQMKEFLTPEELDSIVEGILTITFEQALRFLDDYLSGDTYYQTTKPKQNLTRARCQFTLFEDMLRKREDMETMVRNYR